MESAHIQFHVDRLCQGDANLRESAPGDNFVSITIGRGIGGHEATFFLSARPVVLREALATLDRARERLSAIVSKIDTDGKREAAA